MKHEECEYCDGVVERAVRRVPFRSKKETIYVDNVPVGFALDGEIYCEAAVYKKLEKIAANGKHSSPR
jgi:hypothetical protein